VSPHNSTSQQQAVMKTEDLAHNDSSRFQPSAGSPQTAQRPMAPPEGYAGTMEGASGVPDKIDEGIEPD
jgi:hypothetical protein